MHRPNDFPVKGYHYFIPASYFIASGQTLEAKQISLYLRAHPREHSSAAAFEAATAQWISLLSSSISHSLRV